MWKLLALQVAQQVFNRGLDVRRFSVLVRAVIRILCQMLLSCFLIPLNSMAEPVPAPWVEHIAQQSDVDGVREMVVWGRGVELLQQERVHTVSDSVKFDSTIPVDIQPMPKDKTQKERQERNQGTLGYIDQIHHGVVFILFFCGFLSGLFLERVFWWLRL